GADGLPGKDLDAAMLSRAVAAVARRTLPLLVRHESVSYGHAGAAAGERKQSAAVSGAALDLLDLEHREFLTVAAFAAVVLTPLLLEYDHLGAARLLHDPRPHRRVSHRRRADHRRVAADRKHIAEFDLGADLTRDALDGYLVADADAVLLSARPYDCEHGSSPNPFSYRSPALKSNTGFFGGMLSRDRAARAPRVKSSADSMADPTPGRR